jgi:hypothetical protein
MWTDNSPFSYNNWNTGEPSDPMNATHEECVEMYRDNKKWNDVSCFQTKAFVCKGRACKEYRIHTDGLQTMPLQSCSPLKMDIDISNIDFLFLSYNLVLGKGEWGGRNIFTKTHCLHIFRI